MTDITAFAMMDQREMENIFVLAAIQNPNHIMREAGFVPPEIMLDERARRVWQDIKTRVTPDMQEKDAMSIAMQCALEGKFDVFKTPDYDTYTLIIQAPVIASELMYRAQNVKISAALPELVRSIAANDHEQVRQHIARIAGIPAPLGYATYTALDAHAEFMEIVEKDKPSVVKTYIEPFDTALGGLEMANLIILAARPSMGKTALAWQIARNIAGSGKVVFFASLEMNRRQLWMRAACPLAEVDYRTVIDGGLAPAQKKALDYHSSVLAGRYSDKLVIDDRPQTTDSLWQIVGAMRPDVVIIDHIRLFKDRMTTGEKENKRLGRITQNLHNMAKGYNIPVLCLSQLNRETENNGDKRPTLVNLRDSGEIEEDADIVLMLHRPDYYIKDGQPPLRSATEIWIDKNRNGGRNNKIELMYDLKKQWFERRNQ